MTKIKQINYPPNISQISSRKDLKDVLSYEKVIYKKRHIYLFRPVMAENAIAWKIVCLLRYHEYHLNCNHKIRKNIYRFLRKRLELKYGVTIPTNVVGPGLLIFHPRNIMIHAKKCGNNLSIQFNTSLVAGGHDGSIPTLGNNVTIGVGTTIVGDVHIADGIAIGANSLVNKSFDKESVCIAGCPAKTISQNGSFSWGGSVENVIKDRTYKS